LNSRSDLQALHNRHAVMKSLTKYRAIFQTTVINSVAYPGELAGRSLMIIPFMWIFYQLWNVTFEAAGTGTINGLTLADTMWYLMLAETIELSRPAVARSVSDNVKDGSIAYMLNKPYNFIFYQFSNSMGETVFRALMNAVFGSAVVWWLVGAPHDMRGWIAAIPAVLGAWILNFIVACLIGLAAFVVEDVSAFVWIYQKFTFILGGLLIPLDFYPTWLQDTAKALPFAAMLYGPARLFVSPSLELFMSVITMQLVWILILGLLLATAYRRGVMQLTINGG